HVAEVARLSDVQPERHPPGSQVLEGAGLARNVRFHRQTVARPIDPAYLRATGTGGPHEVIVPGRPVRTPSFRRRPGPPGPARRGPRPGARSLLRGAGPRAGGDRARLLRASGR